MMTNIMLITGFVVIGLFLYSLRYLDNNFRDFRIWWYKARYNIEMGDVDSSMMPTFGEGVFVSVIKKGNIIDIIDKKYNRFLRIIPYQPNHGFMVEVWENNKMTRRNHMDINMIAMHAGRNWYPNAVSHQQDPVQC